MIASIGIGSLMVYCLLFLSIFFEVFLLINFLERRLTSRGKDSVSLSHDELPTVAVIVPCYNEEKTVAGTLHSLLALDYPHDKLEIIAVNDGSTDRTADALDAFANEPRIRIFNKVNGGKHTAMNFALAHTKADIVGCLDADSVVSPDALKLIVPAFKNPRVASVTAGIHVKSPQTILQFMQEAEYRLSIFNRYAFATIGSMSVTPGPFSFFRSSVVRELGGWKHAHSTEDMEIAMRIQRAGFLIANVPAAAVHTSSPRTLRALFKQRVRWTYGFLRNMIDFKDTLGSRSFGDLGIVILPIALISIGAALFFFARMLWFLVIDIYHWYVHVELVGFSLHPSFSFFYVNTHILSFLIVISIALIVLLIGLGSRISRSSRAIPIGTPLFILAYGFIVPLWLGTAVVRAALNTGVKWR